MEMLSYLAGYWLLLIAAHLVLRSLETLVGEPEHGLMHKQFIREHIATWQGSFKDGETLPEGIHLASLLFVFPREYPKALWEDGFTFGWAYT